MSFKISHLQCYLFITSSNFINDGIEKYHYGLLKIQILSSTSTIRDFSEYRVRKHEQWIVGIHYVLGE